jgi:hypothetical protein
MAAQRLRRVLHLGEADAELNGRVAILLRRALRDDLAFSILRTVTGICSPASCWTRVIPTFCAITPERIVSFFLQRSLAFARLMAVLQVSVGATPLLASDP